VRANLVTWNEHDTTPTATLSHQRFVGLRVLSPNSIRRDRAWLADRCRPRSHVVVEVPLGLLYEAVLTAPQRFSRLFSLKVRVFPRPSISILYFQVSA